MSARTILTLANGRGIDLLAPRPQDVDFDAYAEHLAKEKRYNGATPGLEYSVAEHLSRGTDAILDATGDRILAAHFHLHDAPEGVLKDQTTPLKEAIAEMIAARCGILAPQILSCFAELEDLHQRAIYASARMPWPSIETHAQVKHWDVVMFVTEWRDLMQGVEHPNWGPYAHVAPLPERIRPWDWQTAKRAWLRRAQELLPALKVSA